MVTSDRILLVADDASALDIYHRSLESQFEIATAAGSHRALAMVLGEGPYAVVVCDMCARPMESVRFLTQVRSFAPATARVMFAAEISDSVALGAVNDAKIHELLLKPCDSARLARAIGQGLGQFRASQAQCESNAESVAVTTEALMNLLGLANPAAFHHTLALRRCVAHLAAKARTPHAKEFETAAMLSQLGCVAMNPEILEFAITGHPLPEADQVVFSAHPMVARTLLSRIHGMEAIAWIVAQQLAPLTNVPEAVGGMPREQILLGGEMLRLAIAHTNLLVQGMARSRVIDVIRAGPRSFSAQLLNSLALLPSETWKTEIRSCLVRELMRGMIVHENVITAGGLLLVAKGQELTPSLIEHLRVHRECNAIKDPILVIVSSAGRSAAN